MVHSMLVPTMVDFAIRELQIVALTPLEWISQQPYPEEGQNGEDWLDANSRDANSRGDEIRGKTRSGSSRSSHPCDQNKAGSDAQSKFSKTDEQAPMRLQRDVLEEARRARSTRWTYPPGRTSSPAMPISAPYRLPIHQLMAPAQERVPFRTRQGGPIPDNLAEWNLSALQNYGNEPDTDAQDLWRAFQGPSVTGQALPHCREERMAISRVSQAHVTVEDGRAAGYPRVLRQAAPVHDLGRSSARASRSDASSPIPPITITEQSALEPTVTRSHAVPGRHVLATESRPQRLAPSPPQSRQQAHSQPRERCAGLATSSLARSSKIGTYHCSANGLRSKEEVSISQSHSISKLSRNVHHLPSLGQATESLFQQDQSSPVWNLEPQRLGERKDKGRMNMDVGSRGVPSRVARSGRGAQSDSISATSSFDTPQVPQSDSSEQSGSLVAFPRRMLASLKGSLPYNRSKQRGALSSLFNDAPPVTMAAIANAASPSTSPLDIGLKQSELQSSEDSELGSHIPPPVPEKQGHQRRLSQDDLPNEGVTQGYCSVAENSKRCHVDAMSMVPPATDGDRDAEQDSTHSSGLPPFVAKGRQATSCVGSCVPDEDLHNDLALSLGASTIKGSPPSRALSSSAELQSPSACSPGVSMHPALQTSPGVSATPPTPSTPEPELEPEQDDVQHNEARKSSESTDYFAVDELQAACEQKGKDRGEQQQASHVPTIARPPTPTVVTGECRAESSFSSHGPSISQAANRPGSTESAAGAFPYPPPRPDPSVIKGKKRETA